MRTAAEMAVGERGTVAALTGEGTLRRRLIDMGFTPGTALTLRRRAPLGDPLEFDLRGYRLSIRRREAATVLLREATQ